MAVIIRKLSQIVMVKNLEEVLKLKVAFPFG